jgi:hypothetical protein
MATAALRVICPTPMKFAALAEQLGVGVAQVTGPRPVKRPRTANWTPR